MSLGKGHGSEVRDVRPNVRLALLLGLVLWGTGSWSTGSVSGFVDQGSGSPLLGIRLPSFAAEGDAEAVLRKLREYDPARILIGFERVPLREGQPDKKVNLRLQDATVGGILRELCRLDQRYEFEIVEGTVITVQPRGAKKDPANLLNMSVRKFSLHGKRALEDVVSRLPDTAPELGAHLRKKALEFAATHGTLPPGSVGAILRGGGEPQIDLELSNLTVRDILNGIAIYSAKIYGDRPPDSMGWKAMPIGWKYEFVIDPNAPTGLGGYPRWSSF